MKLSLQALRDRQEQLVLMLMLEFVSAMDVAEVMYTP